MTNVRTCEVTLLVAAAMACNRSAVRFKTTQKHHYVIMSADKLLQYIQHDLSVLVVLNLHLVPVIFAFYSKIKWWSWWWWGWKYDDWNPLSFTKSVTPLVRHYQLTSALAIMKNDFVDTSLISCPSTATYLFLSEHTFPVYIWIVHFFRWPTFFVAFVFQ